MTQINQTQNQQIHSRPASVRMLQGAGIALFLIVLFLSGVNNPDPSWGKYWMIKPLLVVPMMGAMGGLFYYYMDHLRQMDGWIKIAAYLISIIGYFVAVWMGSVLGLNGTLWN